MPPKKPNKLSQTHKRVLEAYLYFQRLHPNYDPGLREVAERADVSDRIVGDYIRELKSSGHIKAR